MEVYLVGGAVRDQLLGIAVQDRDWVVVGSDAEEMRQRGFLPVGKNFPVFLHPETHEEYALARTEKKSGKGYHGFIFYAERGVTLEEDLRRRDLTMNAMALDKQQNLIDPFGGKQDLKKGLLRHVSPAFSEDPLRILRVARFISTFGFAVDKSTLKLITVMVKNKELLTLSRERVGQEFKKGLQGQQVFLMLSFLQDYGINSQIFPELATVFASRTNNLEKLLTNPGGKEFTFTERLALIAVFIPGTDLLTRFLGRLALSKAESSYVSSFYRLNQTYYDAVLQPESLLIFYEQNDAFRNTTRFLAQLNLLAFKIKILTPGKYIDTAKIAALLTDLKKIDLKTLAAKNIITALPGLIHQERVRVLTGKLCAVK